MTEHERLVSELSEKVKEFHRTGTRMRIFHGSTNSTRPQRYEPEKTLDTSRLNRILKIDRDAGYAIVEPNVPMDALIKETLRFGMMPPVVMEFPGITVGGGIQGGAGESSSFKYGCFHQCALEYEMILGNGDIVSTSREKNPDLFWGTASSYGSLGVMTSIKLRLIPAKKHVQLTYIRVDSFLDAVEKVRELSLSPVDFIDGILFSKYRGAIMVGVLTDEITGPIKRFSRPHDEWFYLHASMVMRRQPTHKETIPLRDYLFRYDRGGFWVGACGFKRYGIPFNRCTRFLLDPFMKTRALYDILHSTNTSQEFFVQDLVLPGSKTVEFLEHLDSRLGIYPIWLCPGKPDIDAKMSPMYLETDVVIDVGVWGVLKQADYETMYETNRHIEKVTAAFKGRKVLYAHSYYPEEEFWGTFDKQSYESLREKYYGAKVFPTVYEKVVVNDQLKSKVVQGLWNIFLHKSGLFKGI